MKEQFYLQLGDLELLAIVVRNGLYCGSWHRMKKDFLQGDMILPGISLKTISTLQSYEHKYNMDLNKVLFSDMRIPILSYSGGKKKGRYRSTHVIQRICYTACRGLFSYPCVAGENRVTHEFPYDKLHRTYLARPLFGDSSNYPSLLFQGVNRMNNPALNPSEAPGQAHDRLLSQLNKIRECMPCGDQSLCEDHKYVIEATDTLVKEYRLENSFVGKLLARSLCWMSAEESRLMRLIEKEGLMIEPHPVYPPEEEEPETQVEFFSQPESQEYFDENSESSTLPSEPHPLLDVLHDLRESIRDTVKLLGEVHMKEKKKVS